MLDICRDANPLEAIMNLSERGLVGGLVELSHDLDNDALALHVVEPQLVSRSSLRYDASSEPTLDLALQRFALLEVAILFVKRRRVEVGVEFVRIRIEFAIGKPSLHLSASHFVVLLNGRLIGHVGHDTGHAPDEDRGLPAFQWPASVRVGLPHSSPPSLLLPRDSSVSFSAPFWTPSLRFRRP
jgi:hypothetical protein